MSAARLVVLAMLALGLVVLAIWTGGREGPSAEGPGEGRLWPGLAEGVGAVQRVLLEPAGGSRVELVRDGDDWRVASRDGWFADSGRVEALLRSLANARKLEAKTTREAHYPLLGVAALDAPGASSVGVGIEIEGRGRQLLVGKPNLHSIGQFVRFADDPQSWLVDLEIEIPTDARRWLDRRLVDVAALRVERLVIAPAGGPVVEIVRTPGEGVGHALAGAGQEFDADRVEAAATLFEGLRLDDVALDSPATDEVLPDRIDLLLHTVDGLELDVHSWSAGPQRWVRFTVGFDVDKARHWVGAEIERDRSAIEAAARPAIDGDAAASAPLDPASAGMAPLDADLRLQQLHEHAQRLQQRLHGWAFSLSPSKQAIIETARDAYLDSSD